MDFDPHHPKWQCCCCHLTCGLKILAAVEISIACLTSAVSAYSTFATALRNPAELSWFEVLLVPICVLCAVTSGLLVAGIHQRNATLMYPTLAARAIFVAFVQAFGVSTVVRPHTSTSVETTEAVNENGKWKSNTFHEENSPTNEEPSVALRLMFLTFLMIFISIFAFYTIYLVVRCTRFINAYRRLEIRRQSLLIAGQIAPEATCSGTRRTSRISRSSRNS